MLKKIIPQSKNVFTEKRFVYFSAPSENSIDYKKAAEKIIDKSLAETGEGDNLWIFVDNYTTNVRDAIYSILKKSYSENKIDYDDVTKCFIVTTENSQEDSDYSLESSSNFVVNSNNKVDLGSENDLLNISDICTKGGDVNPSSDPFIFNDSSDKNFDDSSDDFLDLDSIPGIQLNETSVKNTEKDYSSLDEDYDQDPHNEDISDTFYEDVSNNTIIDSDPEGDTFRDSESGNTGNDSSFTINFDEFPKDNDSSNSHPPYDTKDYGKLENNESQRLHGFMKNFFTENKGKMRETSKGVILNIDIQDVIDSENVELEEVIAYLRKLLPTIVVEEVIFSGFKVTIPSSEIEHCNSIFKTSFNNVREKKIVEKLVEEFVCEDGSIKSIFEISKMKEGSHRAITFGGGRRKYIAKYLIHLGIKVYKARRNGETIFSFKLEELGNVKNQKTRQIFDIFQNRYNEQLQTSARKLRLFIANNANNVQTFYNSETDQIDIAISLPSQYDHDVLFLDLKLDTTKSFKNSSGLVVKLASIAPDQLSNDFKDYSVHCTPNEKTLLRDGLKLIHIQDPREKSNKKSRKDIITTQKDNLNGQYCYYSGRPGQPFIKISQDAISKEDLRTVFRDTKVLQNGADYYIPFSSYKAELKTDLREMVENIDTLHNNKLKECRVYIQNESTPLLENGKSYIQLRKTAKVQSALFVLGLQDLRTSKMGNHEESVVIPLSKHYQHENQKFFNELDYTYITNLETQTRGLRENLVTELTQNLTQNLENRIAKKNQNVPFSIVKNGNTPYFQIVNAPAGNKYIREMRKIGLIPAEGVVKKKKYLYIPMTTKLNNEEFAPLKNIISCTLQGKLPGQTPKAKENEVSDVKVQEIKIGNITDLARAKQKAEEIITQFHLENVDLEKFSENFLKKVSIWNDETTTFADETDPNVREIRVSDVKYYVQLVHIDGFDAVCLYTDEQKEVFDAILDAQTKLSKLDPNKRRYDEHHTILMDNFDIINQYSIYN